MPADDLVVEIQDDAAANAAAAVDPAAKDKPPEAEPQKADPIAELKAQHDEMMGRERQRASAAEARAAAEQQARAAAEQERDAVRSEAADTQLTAVEQGLAAAQSAVDAAETEYTAALEAGDWKKAGQAQRKLSSAAAQAENFKRDKADLELRKAQAPKEAVQRQAPSAAADPVEAAMARFSPASQAWFRAHPDEIKAIAYGDQRRSAKLNAADSDAVAEGLSRDTPEYFAHVEKFLGLRNANGTNGAGKTTQNGATRRQAPMVAPVQQAAGETQGGGDVVRLTKGEAAAATDGMTLVWNYDDPSPQKKFKKGDPIGIQEMARRKLALQKQGQYDKTYYEN